MTSAHDSYAALADLSRAFDPPSPHLFGDDDLVAAQRSLAEIRKRADAAAAAVAGEIHHRSRRELGYDGLAQRLGSRTAEKLVQSITGLSARDSRSLVRVGELLSSDRPEPGPPTAPWLDGVAAAVAANQLTIDGAELIRAGLGVPDARVSVEALRDAAAVLVREAVNMSVEALGARARELRNHLDAQGVGDREQHLRDQRYLQVIPQNDGMVRLAALLDPESATIVVSALDAATSPRRGGPRFVDEKSSQRAQAIIDDPRTTGQLALDAFVALLDVATKADPSTILGTREPAVQVIVTAEELSTGKGFGFFEGHHEAVSITTAQRHVCVAGTTPVLLEGGTPLDVGRSQRLFTHRQRIALAIRDGGCRFPGCDRPPSWSEAQHITEWRNGGRTNTADGILLCRHHHLLVHNNGWKVLRQGSTYLLRPPTSVDRLQELVPMPSRSAPLRRHEALVSSR